MEALGAFSGIVSIFVIIAAILAFLTPFFVLRIRNEMIKLNKNMAKVIKPLSKNVDDKGIDTEPKEVSTISGKEKEIMDELKQRYKKVCSHCNARNRQEDHTCISCGRPLL